MKKFNLIDVNLKDLHLIETLRFDDARGSFVKNFEKNLLAEIGVKFNISEEFYTVSKKNVLRGLHFQTQNPQSKLITVIKGKIFDVVVDLRKESETFGKWEGFYLDDEEAVSLLIPKGFAHGFLTMTDNSIVNL